MCLTRIEPLESHPEALGAVTSWLQLQWAIDPSDSLSFLPPATDRPGALLAFESSTPIGVLGYKRHQSKFQAKPELWINVLYVLPEFRRRGVGRQLILAGMRVESQFRTGELYVYTDVSTLYSSNGWELRISDPDSQMHTLAFCAWDSIDQECRE